MLLAVLKVIVESSNPGELGFIPQHALCFVGDLHRLYSIVPCVWSVLFRFYLNTPEKRCRNFGNMESGVHTSQFLFIVSIWTSAIEGE